MLAVVQVIAVGSAAAETLPTLFAGGWSTSYPPNSGTGTLRLETTDPATGISALEAVGGPPAGCSAPTIYYRGSYTTGSDYGKVAGCTTDLSGLALTAYYKSEPTERHGNFSVSTSCAEPNSFSGTYIELSEGGSTCSAGFSPRSRSARKTCSQG